MAKFKIGDRVELVKDRCWAKSGMKGAIVSADGSDYGVKFDKRFDGGHDLDGKCERGYGHWAAREDMKLIQRGFAVGQIYRVGAEPNKGTIARVKRVRDDAVDIKVIRGNADLCGFNRDSEAAHSLTLLTGSQIGEAIRKWDEEHSKSGVREVKRSANVGEYIKIVNADAWGHSYKNGDILKVVSCDCLAHAKGIEIGIGMYEYVVLEGYKEGYKPEQTEERRKAKVGDTIKVLRDNGDLVKPGAVWKVKSVDSDGMLLITHADGGLTRACSKDNYIVLSSGKHIYSATDIQTAKDFVLRTIYDLAAKDINVILSHSSGDENDNSAFSCYILGDKAALGDVEGGVKITGTKEYTSSCSENDEPNEWVGKAVALCKALHRPLPSYTL